MRVLLIDDKGVPSLLPVIRSLGIEGHKVYVYSLKQDRSDNLSGRSRYVVKYIHANKEHPEDIFESLYSLVVNYKIDIVLPVKENSFLTFSQIPPEQRQKLKLPKVNSIDIYETVSRKEKLNYWLSENGFNYPDTTLLTGVNDLGKMKFPGILKPTTGAGGKGIYYVGSLQEAVKIWHEKSLSSKAYIFQDYLDLEDIDISFYAVDGKLVAYTIQKGLVRDSFSYAHGIEFTSDDLLLKETKKIISKLEWNGIAHLDFKYNPLTGKYYLLDFNPRFWSTLLGSTAVGVNFPDIIVRHNTGSKVENSLYRHIDFYLSGAALKVWFKKIFSSRPLRFRYTNLFYLVRDPIPEFASLFHKLKS